MSVDHQFAIRLRFEVRDSGRAELQPLTMRARYLLAATMSAINMPMY